MDNVVIFLFLFFGMKANSLQVNSGLSKSGKPFSSEALQYLHSSCKNNLQVSIYLYSYCHTQNLINSVKIRFHIEVPNTESKTTYKVMTLCRKTRAMMRINNLIDKNVNNMKLAFLCMYTRTSHILQYQEKPSW